MTRVVLDASVAAAWLMPSQSTPSSKTLLIQAWEHELCAPAVFEFEVRNFLLTMERRGALSSNASDAALARLQDLEIDMADPPMPADFHSAVAIARAERLSLYDAFYLELAIQRSAALATRDGALIDAAKRRGVDAIDLRG